MKHARLSGSNAHRWMRCPGSVNLEAKCPKGSSEFAREGTAAHALAAECLTKNLEPASQVGVTLELGERDGTFEVNADMAEHVAKYVGQVREWAEEGHLLVEQSVPIDHLTGEEDAESTADCIVISADGRHFRIADLKFGKGVEVLAESNEQLMIYALGALEIIRTMGWEPTEATLAICQPRVSSEPSEWRISVKDLEAFGRRVLDAANAVDLPDAPLAAGDKQCKFCNAKAICPALASKALETIAGEFPDLTEPLEPQLAGAKDRELDNEEIGNCMAAIDLIEDWCRAIRAKVETELFAGRQVPGWKLVAGRRGNRKWRDESEADKALEEAGLKESDRFTKELIGPSQALKKLDKARKAEIEALTIQADGKPNVVPLNDKRPPLPLAALPTEFAVLGD